MSPSLWHNVPRELNPLFSHRKHDQQGRLSAVQCWECSLYSAYVMIELVHECLNIRVSENSYSADLDWFLSSGFLCAFSHLVTGLGKSTNPLNLVLKRSCVVVSARLCNN